MPVSTLLDVVSAALTAIGQVGVGQGVSTEQGAQGLRQANLLLSRKSTQRLFLSDVSTREYTLIPGQADYTIGEAGATFTATRPNLIESAQTQIPGTSSWFPISVWGKPQWDAITGKGATDEKPAGIYPEYTFSNSILAFHVNPIPTGAAKIRLGVWEPPFQFTSLFDLVLMPAAYEAWLEVALTIILAPLYDQPVPQSLIDTRSDALGDLNRYNAQSLGGALSASQRFDSPNLGAPIPTGPPPGAAPGA